MKYLGMWFTNTLTNKRHLDERRIMAIRMSYNLTNCGFNSHMMKIKLKTYLYKIYCQPIMTYGLENLTLNKTELKKLQAAESLIIKKALQLGKFCQSTILMKSVNLESMYDRIIINKLKLLKRLATNNFTMKILTEREH
jgi:hypothetical protein